MAVVVQILQLILALALIGLVLLQRSEGGALGMGGGGGGALMSGRGAADALARLTMVAGGLFLATSLLLTVLSGAARTATDTSVFDRLPFIGRDAEPTPAAPTTPSTTVQDPLAAPPTSDEHSENPAPTTLAAADVTPAAETAGPLAVAPAPQNASTRAGPVANPPTGAQLQPASASTRPAATTPTTTAQPRPQTTTTSTAARPQTATTQRASTTQPATTRTTSPATTPASNGATTRTATPPAAAPATQTAPETAPADTESGEVSGAVEVVRRQRTGPDQ